MRLFIYIWIWYLKYTYKIVFLITVLIVCVWWGKFVSIQYELVGTFLVMFCESFSFECKKFAVCFSSMLLAGLQHLNLFISLGRLQMGTIFRLLSHLSLVWKSEWYYCLSSMLNSGWYLLHSERSLYDAANMNTSCCYFMS